MALTCIALFFIVIFAILYIWDKRRISNGIFLTIGLFFALLTLLAHLIHVADKNDVMRIIITGIFILVVLLIPFLIITIGVSLVFNGRTMVKREGFKMANLLPFALGLLILVLFVWGFLQGWLFASPIWGALFLIIMLIVGYFTFFFITFLLSTFLYQYNFPRARQDFIIVLGSGLINGDRVPPLLASRLNRAIQFYHKQLNKSNKQATFIVSGGQGPNETTSEANAMRLYLLEKGISQDFIIMEDQSTTTYENMLFSKRIMDDILTKYHSIFTTNNFHLFRASLFARKVGLKSEGIGSKTAFYYLPSALIREFIAIIFMYKWVHVILVGLMLLPFILVAITALISY